MCVCSILNPFCVASLLQEVMELLNELESVHFIYVCRKPGGQECDDACDSGASSEDAAQHVSGGQPHSMPTA